ncbi:MAG: hypothetical protein ACKOFI_01655, partial [Phycisphaerales bacterium]
MPIPNPPARAWIALAAAALPAALAACNGSSSLERGLTRAGHAIDATFDGAQREERMYALPVDGIVDVDIETFSGDVVIRGGRDTKGEALINVEVLARHGHARKEDALESLKQVEVRAEVQRGGDVPRLVVRGTSTSPESFLHRTHIDLELPEVRRVRVRTRDGKVQVYENR